MTDSSAPATEHVVFDVFTCDPFQVDLNLFKKWTKGVEETTAAAEVEQDDRKKYGDYFSSPRSLALASIRHQYHFFRLLGEKLERPAVLLDNLELHIPPESHQKIISLYYHFDDDLALRLVGRKLTANLRKDVDDLAKSTNIPLISCLRQYDNFRRVIKAMDSESKRVGSFKESASAFLKHRFCFTDHLIAKYKPFVFMAMYKPRFNDKRLQQMRYKDVEHLANMLMEQWTEDSGMLELSLDFSELRDLKTRFKKDTGGLYKNEVHAHLKQKLREDLCRTIDGQFSSILKALTRIASDTTDGRDFDEMFINLLESVVDVIYRIDRKIETLEAFFDAMMFAGSSPSPSLLAIINGKHSPESWENWRIFLSGMQKAAMILHGLETHHS